MEIEDHVANENDVPPNPSAERIRYLEWQAENMEKENMDMRRQIVKLEARNKDYESRQTLIEDLVKPDAYKMCQEGQAVFGLYKKGLKGGDITGLKNLLKSVEVQYIATKHFASSNVREGPQRMEDRRVLAMKKAYGQIISVLEFVKLKACVKQEKATLAAVRADYSDLAVGRLIMETVGCSIRFFNSLNPLTTLKGKNGAKPIASATGISRVFRQIEQMGHFAFGGHITNNGRTAIIPIKKILPYFIKTVLIPGGWDNKKEYSFHLGVDGYRDGLQNTISMSLRHGKVEEHLKIMPMSGIKAHSCRQVLPIGMSFENETKPNTELLCRETFDVCREINEAPFMLDGVAWNIKFNGTFDMKCVWALEDDGGGSHNCGRMNCCAWNHKMGYNKLKPMCKRCLHRQLTTTWICPNDGQCRHWDSHVEVNTPPLIDWVVVTDEMLTDVCNEQDRDELARCRNTAAKKKHIMQWKANHDINKVIWQAIDDLAVTDWDVIRTHLLLRFGDQSTINAKR